MAVKICVPFPAALLGWKGSSLAIAGFIFKQIGPPTPPKLLVKTAGGVIGLRFPNQGLAIKLPAPSANIFLKIGRFATPIDVRLYSATGAVVGGAVITATNTYTSRPFTLKTKATRVQLIGGNNEAILASICAVF